MTAPGFPSQTECAELFESLGFPEYAAGVRAIKPNCGGRKPSQGPSQWTRDLTNLRRAMLRRIEAGEDCSEVVAAYMESDQAVIEQARKVCKDLEGYLHRLLTLEGFPAVRCYERSRA